MKRVLFAALAAIGCWLNCARGEETRPNIILVMADDQGWGDMAYNGHEVLKTPNFDAMAKAGLRLDRFYAAAPVCSPTRGSVLTGRHPNRFGCFKWGHPLRPQEITLAEVLQQAGYATGHFGKWHLGSVQKESPVNPSASGFDVWLSAPNFYDNDPIMSDQGKAVKIEGESSFVAVNRALEFMENRVKAKQPFLAVVWFGSPHAPHRSASEYAEMYADLPKNQREFYGEITAMDAAFGKLRDSLEPLGIRENTLLWYTSDNGALPVGSSGGRRGKKGQIYDGGLMVPAIVQWPGVILQPRSSEVRGNTADIFPTVLDILGIPLPENRPLDGISLLPLFKGKLESRPAGMGFWDYPAGGISTPSEVWMAELLADQQKGIEPENPARLQLDAGEIKRQYPLDSFPGHAAWIEGDWKLHRLAGKNKGDRFELYHLADDFKESRDLADQQPDRVRELEAKLTAWQQSVIRSLNGEDY